MYVFLDVTPETKAICEVVRLAPDDTISIAGPEADALCEYERKRQFVETADRKAKLGARLPLSMRRVVELYRAQIVEMERHFATGGEQC